MTKTRQIMINIARLLQVMFLMMLDIEIQAFRLHR